MSKEKIIDDLFTHAGISEEVVRVPLPDLLIPEKMFLIFEAFIDDSDALEQQQGVTQGKDATQSLKETYPQNRVTKFVLNIIKSTKQQLEEVHKRLLADFQNSKNDGTLTPQQEETLHEFASMSSNAVALFDTLQFDVWYKEGFSGKLEKIFPKAEEHFYFQTRPPENGGRMLKITNLNQIYIEISPLDARREDYYHKNMNLEAIQFLLFNLMKLIKRNALGKKIIVNEYEPVFFHAFFQKPTSNPHEIIRKYPAPIYFWTHILDINTNYDLEEQYINKDEFEDLAVRNDDTLRLLKIASLRYTVSNPLADRRNHLSAIKLGFSFFDNLPPLTSEENILKIAADNTHFRFGYIFNERQFQLDYLEDIFEARIINFIENELLRLEADFEADILQERLSLSEMERAMHHYHIVRNQINSKLNLHRRKENPHDVEWTKIREKSLSYYNVLDLWDKIDQHLKDNTEFIAEYKDRKQNNMFWILAITFSLNVLFDIIHTMFLPLDNAENLVEFLAAITILAIILITWWRYRNLDKTKQFSHLARD